LTKETAKEKSSPFEPPYVEDLFVGELEGLEGEEGMVALVRIISPSCVDGLNANAGRDCVIS
jgi:hypothetical protein